MKADKQNILLIMFFGIIVLVVAFALISAFNVSITGNAAYNDMGQRMSKMGLTPFDHELAIKFMDENGDGKCDVCGMSVEICIESGQMQCNMGTKSEIGILGSAHIHADFKIYVNEEPINFANPYYYMKSSFIHLDDDENKEKAFSLLHMHATGVPLWIFFRSIGIDFSKNCISLPNEKFCNNDQKTLKFYVNGKPNNEYENYVFKDGDKILISYGSEDITQQMNSVTGYAKNR
ncbi:MAG: hypothetical protein QMD85_01230 [Candidatus Aenigmarchaeota archaeon]|nr:hypothetical protein [Candidatus Aenigmarchaeota archaeon]MDI6722166.1 hypothetical protein [Candidatus Aenigmarchaeota archaeon]